MNYKFLIIIGCLALVACKTGPQVADIREGWQRHCNADQAYCFDIPDRLEQLVGENDVAVFSTPLSTEKKMQYFVQPFHLTANCSPESTGASQTAQLLNANSKIEWGKVDFFDLYTSGSGENSWVDYDKEWPACADSSNATSRYALCSEKDGKTVVICISQMSDNPKLAEDIFKTFRWTKE